MNEQEKATNKAIEQFITDEKPFNEDGKTLTIRTGAADVIEKPLKTSIIGVIGAPAKFWALRSKLHNPNQAYVLFSKQKGEIKLIVDEKSRYGAEVTGKIEMNPELLEFTINTQKMHTVKDLMQLLKFRRVHFAEKEDNMKIVTALQMFKAKVDREIESSNDGRGVQKNINNATVKDHGIAENFVLNIPIFKGAEAKTFVVDIGVTVTDGSILTWLESRDLKDLEANERNRLVDSELKAFEGLVLIEQ